MTISEAVKEAAKSKGINGVLEMVEHCGVPYPRLKRIWNGDNSAKVADVMTVLNSVGLQLKTEES
jgi:hypothetical protein